MRIKHRNAFQEWHDTEQRMAGHRKPRLYDMPTIVALMQGVIAVGFGAVAAWLLWEILGGAVARIIGGY